MTIDIKEKGSKQFYEEIANINSQYMQLLKNPRARLGNTFRLHSILVVVMPVFFILYIIFGMRGAFRPAKLFVLFIIGLSAYASFAYLRKTKKMIEDSLAEESAATLTLDKKGVALRKEGSDEVRLTWGNVAFVRVFNESTCFFAEDQSGTVIPVNNAYKQEILDYMYNSNHHVPVIKE